MKESKKRFAKKLKKRRDQIKFWKLKKLTAQQLDEGFKFQISRPDRG